MPKTKTRNIPKQAPKKELERIVKQSVFGSQQVKRHYGTKRASGIDGLAAMHDAVTQSRDQLYECMKDSLAEERERAVYAPVEREVTVKERVPLTLSLLGRSYAVPLLKRTVEKTEMQTTQEQVGTKKELLYNRPENLRDVLPMVLDKAADYHSALSAYAEEFVGYRNMIDDVIRVHAEAASAATKRFQEFLEDKDEAVAAYHKTEETLDGLKAAIDEQGFDADTIIKYDEHELALHELAGKMYRLDEAIPRYAHLKEVFLNKAKSYSGAASKCSVVADALSDTADAMSIIFQGQMEMDALVNTVGKALELSHGATTDMENTFQYSRRLINEIAQLDLPENADFKGISDVSSHEVQHGVNLVNLLPDKEKSIDAMRDVVVQKYAG